MMIEGAPYTLRQLESLRRIAAEIVAIQGETYALAFQRLDNEWRAALERSALVERARAIAGEQNGMRRL